MATPLHKHDYKNPGEHEAAILDMVRNTKLPTGIYYVPWCSHESAKDPETQKRMAEGPWAMLSIPAGKPNMGRMLGLWFAHAVITSFVVAYIASHAGLAPGAAYLSVFRLVGATTLLAYAGYTLPMYIWHGMPKSQIPGRLIDGLVYSLLTAGTFAWLWPNAPVTA
ncbi:MAG: hypothetical protein H6815_13440 [Phycisphaeraceae bacterium]|nr:hypothetical protein [Phycisphaerales bacterium]MCB9861442.1 hypothetical protein [Phycisphaeraceae bacterium]